MSEIPHVATFTGTEIYIHRGGVTFSRSADDAMCTSPCASKPDALAVARSLGFRLVGYWEQNRVGWQISAVPL